MSRLRKALVGLVVAALLLLGLEGLLRLTVPVEPLLFDYEKPDPQLFLSVDTQARYQVDLPPGKRFTLQDGPHSWTWVSNSLGMREDHEVAPTGEGFRVLALGDSWMFGSNADQGRTLPDRLEELLALRHDRAEVMNLGIRGASAWDMLRRYRQFAASFEYDAVLLVTPHNQNRYRDTADARSAWGERTAGAPRSDWRLYLLLRRGLLPLTRAPYAERPSGDEVTLTTQDLLALVQEVRLRDKPVYLLINPGNWSDIARHPDRPVGEVYLEPLREYLSGWTWHRLDERVCWGNEDLGHPSEAGYGAMAAVVDSLMAGGPSPAKPLSEPRCR